MGGGGGVYRGVTGRYKPRAAGDGTSIEHGHNKSCIYWRRQFVGQAPTRCFARARQEYRRSSDSVKPRAGAGCWQYAKSRQSGNGPGIVRRHTANGTGGRNDVGVFRAGQRHCTSLTWQDHAPLASRPVHATEQLHSLPESTKRQQLGDRHNFARDSNLVC